jgi:hypothetical protein
MEQYIGLAVSLKMSAICIVDRTGKIERWGMVASDSEAIAESVRHCARGSGSKLEQHQLACAPS